MNQPRENLLAIDPYHASLLAGVLGGILCSHRADVNKFAGQPTLACPYTAAH